MLIQVLQMTTACSLLLCPRFVRLFICNNAKLKLNKTRLFDYLGRCDVGFFLILYHNKNTYTSCRPSSQARVSAHSFRNPVKLAWAEHFTWWQNGTQPITALDSCLPMHLTGCWCEVLKSWATFLESQGMPGGCWPIMLPLLQAVNGWKVALPKWVELGNSWWCQFQKAFSPGGFARVSETVCQDPGLWGSLLARVAGHYLESLQIW